MLCDGSGTDALLALPLPAAHHRLGPLVLRDALRALAGPAWNLQVDKGERRVCFIRVAPDVSALPRPPLSSTGGPSEDIPLVEEVQP